MFSSLVAAGVVLAAVAQAAPQAVTAVITPPTPAPSGCVASYPSPFQITTTNVTTSSHSKRQDNGMGSLIITLQNGRLTNAQGDVGYTASNSQFQFDPVAPQAGATYTGGFSVCPNGTLALGGSALWWSCNSGKFNNLYEDYQGAQCSRVYIQVLPQSGSVSASAAPSSAVTQTSDAQPQGMTSAPATSAVTQISDNQPQAMTSAPATSAVTQISDHQPQAATSAPAAITQISDHQPQAPTQAPNATYTGGAAFPTGMANLALAGAGLAAAALL